MSTSTSMSTYTYKFMYKYTYTYRVPSSLKMSQSPQSLFRCVKIRQVYKASSVFSIVSSAVATVSKLTRLVVCDFIWITVSNFIWLTIFDLILLSFLPFDFTYVKRIYYQFETHHSSPIPVMLWGVPHWTGCLQKN